MKRFVLITSLVLLTLVASACGNRTMMGSAPPPSAGGGGAPVASVGAVQIVEPWSRPGGMMNMPGSGGGNGAAYLTIKNTGAADRLIRAESAVAKSVELHTVEQSGNTMQMKQVEGIDVPANGSVELKPGGFHVMLIGLNQELKPDQTFTVKLTFEKAGTVEAPVKVRQP